MGFWNFIGKLMLFDFIRKQLFGGGKSLDKTNYNSSARVRRVVPEHELERELDALRGYNEEALEAVDDFESRLDDYESEHYTYPEDDDEEDDYYSAAGRQSNYDYFDHDDFDDSDHYDFDHYDFLDDHDW